VREILSLQKDSCPFSTRRSDAQDLLLMGLSARVLANSIGFVEFIGFV